VTKNNVSFLGFLGELLVRSKNVLSGRLRMFTIVHQYNNIFLFEFVNVFDVFNHLVGKHGQIM
jgi:hypothetical protein